VRLQDYRGVPETGGYDRIASVGMFEHVGSKTFGAYICQLKASHGNNLPSSLTIATEWE
jgi:cyclopropane-fatty-acyl-phospholipid synthase